MKKTIIAIWCIVLLMIFWGCDQQKTTEPETYTVAAPIFSLPSGTYTTLQTVSITCSTFGAEIRYTVDGSEPASTSTLYINPINIVSAITLKAKAYKNNWNTSPTVSADYNITSVTNVADPIFNPASGIYSTAQLVSISCSTLGAEIRYTINGADPDIASSLYTSSINIQATTTLKARAFKEGLNPSQIGTALYTIEGSGTTVEDPIFTPPAGTYSTPQSITISCTTPGAQIRYTTNGSMPTPTSNLYTYPLNVSSATTIKAKAFLGALNPSQVVTASYTITMASLPGMVFVEGGSFSMGNNFPYFPHLPSDGTVHTVTLDPYYIGKYEVTQSDFYATMGYNPSYFAGRTDRPVERVSWYETLAYCNKRSVTEGLSPCYSYSGYGTNPDSWPEGWDNQILNNNFTCNFAVNGYRLPTEAEWEFAAKGGNRSHNEMYSGVYGLDSLAFYEIDTAVWYNGNSSDQTHAVGQKLWNEIGAFDMSGNVFEWCWDWYDGSYYNVSPTSNPKGPDNGTIKVFRGGSWYIGPDGCRVSARYTYSQNDKNYFLGFRLARTLQ
jgi:formylglycine-generating enzyme